MIINQLRRNNPILSIQNLSNGSTECIIEWKNNTITTARALNIGATVTGTALCVDAALSIIDPYFTDPANGFTITYTNTGVTILKNPNGSNTFSLATDYLPLLTLLFRAEPGTTSTVNVSGFVVQTGFTGIPITAASASQTAPAGFTLGGFISKVLGSDCSSGGGSIPGVTVGVTPSPTICFPNTGYPASQLFPIMPYAFFNASGQYTYIITPSKNGLGSIGPRPECCGVTYQDIIMTRDLILGTEPRTLAKMLAADFNGDGFATTYDISNMWHCLNSQPIVVPSGWLSWRFAPLSEIGGPNDPPAGDMNLIPSSITTPLVISSQTSHHFFGVKRGDVNGSCTDCGTSFNESLADGREIFPHKSLEIKDQMIKSGQELVIPITLSKSAYAATILNVALGFNLEYIEVTQIENGDLSTEFSFSEPAIIDENEQMIYFPWLTMAHDGENITDGATLFKIHVRAKKDILSLRSLIMQPKNPDLRAISTTKERSDLVLHIVPSTNLFSAQIASSNLISSSVQVDIIMPASGYVNLTVVSSAGTIELQERYNSLSGLNNIRFSNLPFSSGVYTIAVQSEYGIQNLRFIKI